MPGDYSRFSFDPRKRFSRLLMQQGKVQLDSDWNELVELLTRRDRVQANDVFGPAAVPRATTPTAFEITTSTSDANDLAIGRGRMYVDGLLAEAFGSDTYLNQPFVPDPPSLASFDNPQGLAYLDVWDREITAVDDESLLEPALGGVDTSTRTQTVWQVKIEPGDLDCATDLDDRFQPSAGRLTVRTTPEAPETDPCQLPESGGLRDVENRFYRVEIHDVTPPRFKFFRDPVATRISGIEPVVNGATTLVVRRTGLDSVLRFSDGQWVEVTSDWLELNDKPGLMAKIAHVDHDDRKIRLSRAIVEADIYGPPVAAETAADRRARFPARLIRWDQSGDDVDADGLLPVQLGEWVSLELGVEVKFSIAAGGSGKFARGDHWHFPTRVAGRTAGPLEQAPPAGIIHHYAALARVNGLGPDRTPGVMTSCRTLWPPETQGGDCECTVCVTPESHATRSMDIQGAIREAERRGGGKVCLRPGIYPVDATIEMNGVSFLSMVGHGRAIVMFTGGGPVFHAEGCIDSGIEGLIIIRSAGKEGEEGIGVRVRNCLLDFTIDDCEILLIGSTAFGDAVRLEGFVHASHIQRNFFLASRGVAGQPFSQPPARAPIPLNGVGVSICDNVFVVGKAAIDVTGISLLMNIEENAVASGADGILVSGTTLAAGSIVIDDNDIDAPLRGIVFNTSDTTISSNRIAGRPPADAVPIALIAGIVMQPGSVKRAVSAAKILANRIGPEEGAGIFIGGETIGAMIKDNSIASVAGSGIVLTQLGESLSIENNVIRDVARPVRRQTGLAGIALAPQSAGEVSNNVIERIGPETPGPAVHGVLATMPARLRISGNHVRQLKPAAQGRSAGIAVVQPFGSVEIVDNDVFFETPPADETPGTRSGILVGAVSERETPRAEPASIARLLDRVDIDPRLLFSRLPLLVLIRANVLRATGGQLVPLVEVGVPRGRCTFGGNFAVVEDPDGHGQDVVILAAGSVVADSNQVIGGERQGLTIRTGEGPWTLLGNIVAGGITVNRVPLDQLNEPWRSGNRG